MKPELPRSEGVRQYLFPAERRALHQKRLSESTVLADLLPEYVFATTILLFSHGAWTRDPAVDYLNLHPGHELFWLNLPLPLFEIESEAPPFGGHPWSEWEHCLLLCPRNEWPDFERYFATLAGLDPRRRRVHRICLDTVLLPDPLAWMQQPLHDPARVPVTVTSLDGNWARVAFAEPHGLAPARVCEEPPTRAARLYAEAVLTQHPSPFAAVEKGLTIAGA